MNQVEFSKIGHEICIEVAAREGFIAYPHEVEVYAVPHRFQEVTEEAISINQLIKEDDIFLVDMGGIFDILEYCILEDKQGLVNSKRQWLIMEGDWGGQIYLTVPVDLIGTNIKNSDLDQLLKDLDKFSWSNNGGASWVVQWGFPGMPVMGGMGGGCLINQLCVHDYFHADCSLPQESNHFHLKPEKINECFSCAEVKMMRWGDKIRNLLDLKR